MATRSELREALIERLMIDLRNTEKTNVALYDVVRKLLTDLQHDRDSLPDVEDTLSSAPFQFKDSA